MPRLQRYIGYAMKERYIKIGIVVLILAVVGFFAFTTFSSSNGKQMVTDLSQQPPDDTTWISPAKVNIDNFHEGATAEFPLTIHCGNQEKDMDTYQKFSVITEPDETIVDLGISRPLYENSVSHVQLKSDNPKDKLEAISCSDDGMTITISGFVADDSRLIDVNYKGLFIYSVKYRLPSRQREGVINAPDFVEDWVETAETLAIFNPNETRDILVAITMPEDFDIALVPPSFEYWIGVTDVTTSSMVKTELCTRCMVKMRT